MPARTPTSETVSGDLLRVLAQLVADYVREYARVAERYSLSAAQARALAMAATPLPMRTLADKLSCDASNVTGIVSRLEARGLVERHTDGADRRVKQVVMTKAGRELHDRLVGEFAFARDALGRLSASERTMLCALLTRVALRGDDQEA
jgi:DNA-binding MarR family transcriptional regulator